MARDRVRVGIIGLGHIGKYHVAAIRRFRGIELAAVCDRRREFSTLAPAGIPFFSDYQQVLRDRSVEAVVIATPNQTHYLLARQALEAGKQVILEKPAASSREEMERLESAARRAGRPVYYAFHAAAAPDVEWFARYYRGKENRGKLGPVTGFASRFYDPYVTGGVLEPGAGGLQDCWLDSGINAVSVLLRVMGAGRRFSVENVSAAVNRDGRPRFLQCHAQLSFSVGGRDRSGMGTIDTNWSAGRDHKSTVFQFARSGNLFCLDHSAQKIIRSSPDGRRRVIADLGGGRERLYNHYLGVFRDYLSRRARGAMNGRFSLAAHGVVFDVEDSINRGFL